MTSDLPGLFVDPACPVEWEHPLNLGLVADFTVIPNSGWRGSKTVRNLVRGGRNAFDATITNPSSPVQSNWVGGRGRPGGYGNLTLAVASNQYAVTTGTPVNALPVTLVSFGNAASAFNGNTIAICDSADAQRRLEVLWLGSAGGTLRATHNDGTTSGSATTTATFSAGSWRFTAAVFLSATSRTVYLESGVGTSTATNTTNVANSMANLNNIALGARASSSPGILWNGLLDSGLVYNRALSNDTLQALRREILAGNPERLRWVKGTTFGFVEQAAGGGTAVPVFYHQLQQQGIAA